MGTGFGNNPMRLTKCGGTGAEGRAALQGRVYMKSGETEVNLRASDLKVGNGFGIIRRVNKEIAYLADLRSKPTL